MKLVYVYHSCCVIEAGDFAVIIDYYKDSGESHARGYVHDELLCRGDRLYVLASHSHPDHFRPDVLAWKNEKREGDIVYLFSDDILQHGKARATDALFLKKGEAYQDSHIRIKAFGSTDIGISFLIETEGKRLFHAGDLNNWHWMEESTKEEVKEAEEAYLQELELLANAAGHIHVAMFPVDPRLGSAYMRGAEQFVSRIRTEWFIPMHFGEAYDKVLAFKDYALKHDCRLVELTHKGQRIEL
ncbi:MAG: MBL fold metallo-hydrolase [Tannerellaceae bacterium]|jgi:L-ascorbate metabolism protein UlaG (beta-lactamase superfamily)|nr:MBL fold metallo-hydrolase [Tannerellaceae bacterium]